MKRLLIFLALACSVGSISAQTVWKQDFTALSDASLMKSRSAGLKYAESIVAVGANFIRMNINGDIEWQKKFAGNVDVIEFLEMDNGDIFCVGTNQIGGGSPSNELVVCRLDQNGNVIWNNKLQLEGMSCGARCVKQFDDQIVVGGWTSTDVVGQGDVQGLLVVLDGDGTVTMAHEIEENISVADVLVEGSTFICGGTRGEDLIGGFEEGYLSVFAVDTAGTVNWWRDYSFGPTGGSLASLDRDESGDIWAIGTVNQGDIAFLEMTSEGVLMQSHRYSAGPDIHVVDASFDDAGILCIGANIGLSSPQMSTYWRPCLIRTNQQGEQQIFSIWDNSDYVELYTLGVSTLQDTTVLWSCMNQTGTEVFKYSQAQPFPFPDCQFFQPNVSYFEDDVVEEEWTDVVTSELALTSVNGPNVGGTLWESSFACSENLCDATATIVTDGVQHCANDPFEYWVNEDYEYFTWYLDGEYLGEEPTGQVNFTEFGFHELFVEAIDSAFCPATDVISLTVFPNPEPELSYTDSVYGCVGDLINLQLLNADDYEFNFWYPGGINSNQINVNLPNSFWVESLSEEGCTGISDTIQVIFGAYPEPVLLYTDSAFCGNESFVVSTQEFDSYAWSNGDSTSTIESNVPGTYFVEVSTIYGCSAVSDSIEMSVLDFPTPLINASGPLTWCISDDEDVILYTDQEYDMLEWNNGMTEDSLLVDVSGVFWYSATNEAGCSGVSDTLTVIEWLAPTITIQDTTVSLGDLCQGSIDLSITTETPEYTVEWNELPGEEALSVNGLCTGEYTVVITDENGCSATATITIDSGVGILELNKIDFVVYPNPTSSVVRFDGQQRVERVRIVDESGRSVLTQSENFNSLDVSRLSSGTYVIELLTEFGVYTQALIIE